MATSPSHKDIEKEVDMKILNGMKTKKINVILGLGLLWILGGYILYPALRTLGVSLTGEEGWTFDTYKTFFSSEAYGLTLRNSIVLGLLTVLVCGLIGTSLAFFVHYYKNPFGKFIDKLLLLPVVLPGLIIVIAFIQLYGESGLVTKTLQTAFHLKEVPFKLKGLGGILFIHAYTQYVYFYMNVSLAIKHIDGFAVDAARNLGASKWQVFKTILVPFIKPSLLASAIMTFMTGIGSFSAPSMVGGSYKVMTTSILLSKANNYMALAASQVVILTTVSLVYLGLMRFYEGRVTFSSGVKSTQIKGQVIQSRGLRWLANGLPMILVVFIMLPIVTVLLLSFVKPGSWMIDIYPSEFSWDNYIKIISKKRATAPFINSLTMAGLASMMCVLVSIPASYLVVKTKSRLKPLIELLIMLPWAIPSSAIAVNTINAFNQPSVITGNKILVGSYVLLPIAYAVSLVPLMYRATNLSLQNLNDIYIEASKSLNARGLTTFRRIILPFVSPGIISGVILIIIRCLGEYTISAFLYTADNRPLSIAMVNGVFEYEIGLAMAYGAVVLIFALGVNIIARRLESINEH